MTNLAEDAAYIVDAGELRPGVIFYGLCRPAGLDNFVLGGILGERVVSEWTLTGEAWNVRMWEISVVMSDTPQWASVLRSSLKSITSAGAAVSWVGFEGNPFVDPPKLFDPSQMDVVAYYRDAVGMVGSFEPRAELQLLSRAQLEQLRRATIGLSDAV